MLRYWNFLSDIFIIEIYYLINNVIIIEAKFLLTHAKVTLADFGYPV